jgi:hypothetical protein
MSLVHGYGVVIGTLDHFVRDPVNNYGQYYHGNVYVTTPAGLYHCAIDVDTKMTNDGIEWRVVPMTSADLKGIDILPNGWHSFTSDALSGALDNIRTTAFHRPGCSAVLVPSPFLEALRRSFPILPWGPILEAFRRLFERLINPPWTAGSSIDALNVFEPLLNSTRRLFIFGEPFTYGGLGVHNIHQNQGDPSGSQWWAENGIWQDGTTIIEKNDGSFVAFLTKFKTQAYVTDNNGHPLP